MAHIYETPSRTFAEYLLLPGLTRKHHTPEAVQLQTPLVRHRVGESAPVSLNVPVVSAVMQAVSDHNLAIALARSGGLSFIYGSQSIERQAAMIKRVKSFKAGYVESDSNLGPEATQRDVVALVERTGHSTIAITADGSRSGRLVGMILRNDHRPPKSELDRSVSSFMTPFERLVCAHDGVSLEEAQQLIWEHKLDVLPVIDGERKLVSLIFRKDFADHDLNPNELEDARKRLRVGAGINTRDYAERIPALVEAGVDCLCIDSSDGYSEWQADTIRFVRETYGDSVKIGAGNVVDAQGFRYLAEAGADFVKVGIGGGSICITREQKGIGRGQATAVIEVAAARDAWAKETGMYVPICSDGGIVHDYHMLLALAMGADFVMMGRYFARFDEAPGRKLKINGSFVKEYWGEGSNRARNWQRYDMGDKEGLSFEEGVDSYVPYAGHLAPNLALTLAKIRSTMCNIGVLTLPELRRDARMTVVSATSIIEGGAHDVMLKDRE